MSVDVHSPTNLSFASLPLALTLRTPPPFFAGSKSLVLTYFSSCHRIFELRSIETVTDAGMEAVAKAIAGNMRNLVIASLENMTDAAFNTFSEYCPNIQTLQIVGSFSHAPMELCCA